jgi:hypothetical protein
MGRVDTLYHEFKMSAHEAAMFFGEQALSQDMRDTLTNTTNERSRHEPRRILHGIRPRKERDLSLRDDMNMEWEDTYLEWEEDHIMDEGGFRWFPCLVPRWEKGIPWSPWGFGRGHLVLPESRTLQFIDFYALQALPLHVYPPFWMAGPNAEEAIGRVTLKPGKGNSLAPGTQVTPYESGARYDLQQLEREDRRARVRRAFFLDFLQFLPDANKNQPEPLGTTEMRARFMARVMGAPLLNFMGEVLNPLIDISFGLLLEAGAFPFPPDAVIQAAMANNRKLDPEYTGPLARAQNEDEVGAIQEALELGTRLAAETGDDMIRQNLDFNAGYRQWMEVRGVPKSLIRDSKEMQKLLQARQEQQAQQAQMDQISQGAEAARNAAPMLKAVRESVGA